MIGSVEDSRSENAECVVRVENATKKYHVGSEDIHALDGASLDIHRGEMLSVMGPSGSGKTTLLNMIGCLDAPDNGGLWFDDVDIVALKEKDRAKLRPHKIGFIFQQFYLIPTLTALENVKLPMHEAGMGRKEAEERGRELLASMGLEQRMKHKPSQLSGGEQQRVAIARAMANSPVMILADEPTGELDSKNASRIVELLRSLVKSQGLTVVVVSHDPNVTSKGDRVVYMEDGKIVRKDGGEREEIDI